MKKTLALLLALIMIFALAAPVMADTTGSITVSNAVTGETYSIYRIFDLESYNSTSNAYAYKVNSAWSAFFDASNNTGALNYVDISQTGYVTWKDGAAAAAFAQLALKYAKDNNIAPTKTETADGATVKFTGLELGYYLVDSSLGALCALNTTKPDATVEEKNSKGDLEKFVKNDNGDWVRAISANRGETVAFKTELTVGKGAENYTIHDYMDADLSFKAITAVKLNGTAIASENYTVTNPGTCGESVNGIDCTFEVSFAQTFCKELNENDVITVEYTAVNNKDLGEVKNYAKLSYGDGNATPPSEVTVKTFEFIIIKWNGKYAEINSENIDDAILLTAEFKLTDAEGNTIYFVTPTQEEIDACWGDLRDDGYETLRYKVWNADKDEESVKTSVIKAGFTEISGLEAGVYYLEETVAPDGFNKIADKMNVVIDENGNVTVDGNQASAELDDTFVIINNTGAELPSTGGIGTTVFYIVGGLLMVGAAVVLVTRKKVGADK